MATASELGIDALHTIQSTEPPVWLAPTEELSRATRLASCYLFSSLKPSCPKSPFEHLLVDDFDAEQIWQQIDLQSQPLLLSLRTEVNKFEKNPEEIRTTKNIVEKKTESKDSQDESEDSDMDMDGFDVEDEDSDQEENENVKAQERGVEASEEEEEEEGEEKGIEDKFLKIKELQEYLEEGEAEEFGLDKTNKKKKGNARRFDDSDEDDEEDNGMEDEDEDEDEEEDEEELEGIDALGDEVEDEDTLENARYKDFFGSNKNVEKRKSSDSRKDDNDSDGDAYQDKETLSTHEKTLQKLKSKIEVMEKANLDPKHWTLQGEVTAAKRAKNSALEVELDFEHNVRPAPVITEEVTASLEDMIKKRILEGQYNDVEKARNLPEKAPRERKELDDNKSKKGLAEVYEEKYVENTNPAFAPTSHSDELKKEASMLFKKVCLKLDALSHFHFTPKPVIEDMSIQVNVPALAMEEIAPVAVSDAAMLAPEEIFAGKGDFKEEAELTQANRKRRRANKKRKFKAEGAKRMAKNGQSNTTSIKKAEDE